MLSDRKSIRRVSFQIGLGRKFVSKDVFLSALLKQLEDMLGPETVLKGGTAISRANYLDTPRFSEDIDLDVYTDRSMKEIGQDFSITFEKLEDFTVERPRVHRLLVRFDAYFQNHFDEKDRIRIELAPQRTVAPNEGYAPMTILQSQFTGGVAALLRTYPKEDLFARKIHALSGRKEGKDAFDVLGMWRHGIDVGKTKSGLIAIAAQDSSTVSDIIDLALGNLQNMKKDTRRVMNSANHYIPRWERPDWKTVLDDVGNIILEMRGA
jgi:predicted nucleotidyltransferase component of viral defense system